MLHCTFRLSTGLIREYHPTPQIGKQLAACFLLKLTCNFDDLPERLYKHMLLCSTVEDLKQYNAGSIAWGLTCTVQQVVYLGTYNVQYSTVQQADYLGTYSTV